AIPDNILDDNSGGVTLLIAPVEQGTALRWPLVILAACALIILWVFVVARRSRRAGQLAPHASAPSKLSTLQSFPARSIGIRDRRKEIRRSLALLLGLCGVMLGGIVWITEPQNILRDYRIFHAGIKTRGRMKYNCQPVRAGFYSCEFG